MNDARRSTSKSRLAVDREFMYIIGSAGPGRAEGRTGGQRADGRTDGGRTILNDNTTVFVVFYTKYKNIVFFCRFASDGSASTDFYCKNEKRVQNRCNIDCFFNVSQLAIAQVPIFIVQKSNFGRLRGSRQSRQNGARTATSDPPTTRRGSR